MGISLAEPDIGDLEKEYVMDALESGWINTIGPYVTRFQDNMARFVGVKRGVAVTNGTSGLFMALKAMGIGPGDKVLTPTITFVASINAIIHAGAEPVFFDCDEHLNIDVEHVESYLMANPNRAKAIMPVHIFGHPCDMIAINRLAQKYGLKVIEDACEAIGSESNAGSCGNAGDIGVFSFSFNKMITSGNGGMVLTDDDNVADKIRYWITQSKDDAQNYIHNEVGYNLGLTNIHAALGCAQLERITGILSDKRYVMNNYMKHLKESRLFLKPPYAETTNYWFVGYDSDNKQKILDALRSHSIQVRPLWTPNHLHKPFKGFECFGKMDRACYYADRVVNLPCSTTLTDKQIGKICSIIKGVE